MSNINGTRGHSPSASTSSTNEEAKEAANRALLFGSASPASSPGAKSRSLNTSGTWATEEKKAIPPSVVNSDRVETKSVPSSPTSTRFRHPDNNSNNSSSTSNNSSNNSSSNSSNSSNSTNNSTATPTTRHLSPPKWSQLQHRHHLHAPAPNPAPSAPPIAEMETAKEQGKPTNTRDQRRASSSKNLVDDYGGEEFLRQKLTELKDRRRKSNYTATQVDQMLSISLDNLNITSDDINFDELEAFLKESQQDVEVKQALMEGVELKEYGKKVEEELHTYLGLQSEIVTLHTKLGGCVDMLDSFETLLDTFQADLANISDDIKTMQDQSISKNVKINNRRGVIDKLHRFVEDLSLPPAYVQQLEKGTIDMTYIQSLATFNRKLGFIELNRNVPSITDMYRKFTIVLDKVIVRVQKYIISHTSTVKSFAQLRETQAELCELSYLFQFLFLHAPDNARDVKAVYMDACDKFYTNYYKSYLSSLAKLQFDVATKNDVIGIEDNKLRGFFSSKLSKVNTKASLFALGTRGSLVENFQAPPMDIVPASTPPSQMPKHGYEELFRSLLRLLVDQATCEFMFVRDFFLADDDVTLGIFPHCSELLMESIEGYTANSFDTVGLLIILCIIDRFTEILPPELEHLLTMLQKATTVIFTRFLLVFEMNTNSIRTANPRDLGPVDIRTHYITRRYGEFVASILTFYGTLPDKLRDTISVCMTQIREAMTQLLVRLSGELKDKKDQAVFLINNYDLILSLIQHRGVNAEEVEHFTTAQTAVEETFVKLQRQQTAHIAQIVNYVEEIGPLVAATNDPENIKHPNFNKDVAEALLKQFSHQWRQGLETWKEEMPKYFSNFTTGMTCFQKAVDHMFSYYKQFVNIISKSFKPLKTSKFYVAETEIIRELRAIMQQWEGTDT